MITCQRGQKTVIRGTEGGPGNVPHSPVAYGYPAKLDPQAGAGRHFSVIGNPELVQFLP
jgi:hypothetical protein